MTCRFATSRDCPLLAELNQQLIRDEGHRNTMTIPELEGRMLNWLQAEYQAVLFENENGVIGYALFRTEPELIYLRQFFIHRNLRRKGYGRAAMALLRDELWPKNKRLTVDVLASNTAGIQFWRAMGYREYSLLLEIMPSV